jgi:hypothetical protein
MRSGHADGHAMAGLWFDQQIDFLKNWKAEQLESPLETVLSPCVPLI